MRLAGSQWAIRTVTIPGRAGTRCGTGRVSARYAGGRSAGRTRRAGWTRLTARLTAQCRRYRRRARRRAGGAPGAAPGTQAAPPGEQQAAAQVAALLAQSVSDRGAVVQAVSDVSGCGPSLAGDEQTFSAAASSRASLLSQLSGVPDAATLPA